MFEGDARWRALPVPTGDRFAWEDDSTYIRRPPFLEGLSMTPAPPADIRGARVLALLGDSITTDHISPAGTIKADSPAGKYLVDHGVSPKDFNSYGARRGNHEVMMRGTFANTRIKNQLVPGVEGGVTAHLPGGEVMPIYDAADAVPGRGRAAGGAGRQGVRLGLVARLGGQGHDAARREGGDRRELRAHPPQQPGQHGRAAAAVPDGESAASLGLTGRERYDLEGAGAALDRARPGRASWPPPTTAPPGASRPCAASTRRKS